LSEKSGSLNFMTEKFNTILSQIIPSNIKRMINFYRWEYPKLNQKNHPKKQDHRVLIIHDFSAQPFSVGEMIVSLEGSLILREQYGNGRVDIAILYDRQKPVVDQNHNKITGNNLLLNLSVLLNVAQVNPYFGSLFLFDAKAHLEQFILDNMDRYTVWPSAVSFTNNKYLYYEVLNEIVYPYFAKNKRIPTLSCIPALTKWAQDFYQKNVYPDIPVTIQIRNNPHFHQQRNLNIDCWIEFLQFCSNHYPAKFVLIGTQNEKDERFKKLNNVIEAKNFLTGLDQDLSLIQLSAIHMGATSGPCWMALFSSKPCFLVRSMIDVNLGRGLVQNGCFVHYSFSTPYQWQYTGEESKDLLISEFKKMWNSLEITNFWSKMMQNETETNFMSWLR